jgi:hypothetical protein
MILGISFTQILAIVGGASIILGFIKLLLEVVPRFGKLKTNVYKKLSDSFKYKSLEKRAISSDIENVVNDSVSHLQQELPIGWINKAKIEWVKDETKKDLDEDELILRIKPINDQDRNLMNGIYYYFTKVIFPKVKIVIPADYKKAAVLHLSRRTITNYHPYAISKFEENYLEPAIHKDAQIVQYLDNYQNMDQHGYFTSVYLREATDLAKKIQFSAKRMEINNELDGIINQIITFNKKCGKMPELPDNFWTYKSDSCSYAFLLVARPKLTRKVNTYVNRAKIHISNNIMNLYILGANREKSFVDKVIREISYNTEYKKIEQFELFKDYRGEPGGVCALFSLTPIEKSDPGNNSLESI